MIREHCFFVWESERDAFLYFFGKSPSNEKNNCNIIVCMFFAISARLINEYYDNGNEVGSINIERFNTVLKNAAYGSVKIIQ